MGTSETQSQATPIAASAMKSASSSSSKVASSSEQRFVIPPSDSTSTDSRRMDKMLVKRGVQMSVPYTILAGLPAIGPEEWHLFAEYESKIDAAILSAFRKCNDTCNVWNPDSELCKGLNVAAVDQKVEVSAVLGSVLEAAQELVEITGGRFDPTVTPLTRLWNSCLDASPPREPTGSEVAAALKGVGWGKVIKLHCNGAKPTALRRRADAEVDLCGLAKGWVVDLLVEGLAAAGCPAAYVDWGGDIRSLGQHPLEGRPFRCTIAEPPALQDLFQRYNAIQEGAAPAPLQDLRAVELWLPLASEQGPGGLAIATSGDYQAPKKWGYHHLADPVSGKLCKSTWESPASATVTADTCLLADAIATALATFPTAHAAEQWLLQNVEHLPKGLHRYWIYSRHGRCVLEGDIEEEARRLEAARALRRAMRGVPQAVALVLAAVHSPSARAAPAPPPRADPRASHLGGSHQLAGLTVASLVPCSMAPPLVSFNVAVGSRMHAVLVPGREELERPHSSPPPSASASASPGPASLSTPPTEPLNPKLPGAGGDRSAMMVGGRRQAMAAQVFTVHCLTGACEGVARHFTTNAGLQDSASTPGWEWAEVDGAPGVELPVLQNNEVGGLRAEGWVLFCRRYGIHPAGDHHIIVAEVIGVQEILPRRPSIGSRDSGGNPGQRLMYLNGAYSSSASCGSIPLATGVPSLAPLDGAPSPPSNSAPAASASKQTNGEVPTTANDINPGGLKPQAVTESKCCALS